MPTIRDERVGFMLHPVDLAVNKVLALAGRDEPRGEDLARLDLVAPIDLLTLKQKWLAVLDSVEDFVASRPAEEIGCLYYSASRRAFVDPREVTDSVPHHGRPGGVLPRIPDS